MTHKQWEAMTADEQRVKIAKLCGFRAVKRHLFCDGDECQSKFSDWGGSPPDDGWYVIEEVGDGRLPIFTVDLNAMHLAEACLHPDDQGEGSRWDIYVNALVQLSGGVCLLRAPAHHRAEAFVVAMSKGA